jgi:tetratricopeptide (TPR) repeat protein
MNKPVSHIFTPTTCPSEKELLDYVKGRVDPQRRHDIEAHLADCEMCSDYVEGLSLLSDPDAICQIVVGLNNDIDLAASKKPKARFLRPRIIMSVAAVLAVLVTVTFVLQHQLKKGTGNQQTAEQKFEEATAQDEMSPAEETSEEPTTATRHGGKNAPPLIVAQTGEGVPVYRTTTSGSSAVSSDNKNIEAYYDITLADDDIDDLVMAEVTLDSEITDLQEEESDKTTKTETLNTTTAGGVVEKDEVVSQNRTAKERDKKDAAKTESQVPASAGDQPDEGIVMYENGQYQKSLNYFETILKITPEDQRAQWYYALNLIKLQRTEEAKVLLQTIINNNGDYKKPAEKELKKL